MTTKTAIYSPSAPEPIGPYSQAILAGNFLYISGQIAIDRETGQQVSDSIEQETMQVMKNIHAILVAAGLDFSNVVKTTIFLKSMDDFARVNAVYAKSFGEVPPARETVEASRLPKNANVEISCIAWKG